MKKIIFDLDDTLYKSKDLREKRENTLVNHLGEKAKKYLELKKINSTLKSLELVGISKKEFYEIIGEVPIELQIDNKLKEILFSIKKDYKIIILSNISSNCIKKTLNALGILDLVDEYFGGDNFQGLKPSKENFFMVEKGDICVGNDFDKDLRIPKEKGAVTILISEKIHPEADLTIRCIYELKDILIKQ